MTQPLNTAAEVMVAQAARNLERDLPLFIEQPAHEAHVCIVGGAPSLADTLPALRFAQQRGHLVAAMNGTHDWLIDRGLVPDLHVLLDARQANAEFVRKPRKGVTYLIAAQCHPDVFEALAGQDVIVWVADLPGMREGLAHLEDEKPLGFIGGGSTVALKSMALFYLWGFRAMSLFGMDSCYREDAHHAYGQALNDGERRIDTVFFGRRFSCASWMLAQADDFDADARRLIAHGVTLKAYGSGLIQTLLDEILKEKRNAA